MNPAAVISRIKQAVAQVYGVTIEQLDSLQRWQPLATARHLAMTLAYEGGVDPAFIAAAFQRHRSLVHHAAESIRALRQTDAELRAAEAKVVALLNPARAAPVRAEQCAPAAIGNNQLVVSVSAQERVEGFLLNVVVEYKNDTGGGRVWRKSCTNLDQLRAGLAALGVTL